MTRQELWRMIVDYYILVAGQEDYDLFGGAVENAFAINIDESRNLIISLYFNDNHVVGFMVDKALNEGTNLIDATCKYINSCKLIYMKKQKVTKEKYS